MTPGRCRFKRIIVPGKYIFRYETSHQRQQNIHHFDKGLGHLSKGIRFVYFYRRENTLISL